MVPIAELSHGMQCTVHGRVFAEHDRLRTPFSGLRYATLTVLIDEHVVEHGATSKYGKGSWNRAGDVDFGQRFRLNDGTGDLWIDRQGWSEIEAEAVSVSSLSIEARDASLEAFRQSHASHPGLRELERHNLRPTRFDDTRIYELYLPHEATAEIEGVVEATESGLRLVPADGKMQIRQLTRR